jgi:hypothetical protein
MKSFLLNSFQNSFSFIREVAPWVEQENRRQSSVILVFIKYLFELKFVFIKTFEFDQF